MAQLHAERNALLEKLERLQLVCGFSVTEYEELKKALMDRLRLVDQAISAERAALGMKARTTFCPHCEKKGRRSLVDLAPPYLCLVCGYSMIERRCIDYRKNIVMPLAERKNESATIMLSTPTRVRHLLEMRRSGLIDWEGDLTPKGRELVEKARDES